eukprot:NODE_231_length_13709_cov_0.444526.p7 type:complete len:160 gc:universal NODE_231_length_13709_cov_0.444526:8783-9262(+)
MVSSEIWIHRAIGLRHISTNMNMNCTVDTELYIGGEICIILAAANNRAIQISPSRYQYTFNCLSENTCASIKHWWHFKTFINLPSYTLAILFTIIVRIIANTFGNHSVVRCSFCCPINVRQGQVVSTNCSYFILEFPQHCPMPCKKPHCAMYSGENVLV